MPRSALPNARMIPIISRGFGVWRQMAPDGNGEAATSPPRTRRKRKDGKQFSPPSAAETDDENDTNAIESVTQKKETSETPAPAPPKQNVVVMQVRDIRDVISGAPEYSAAEEDDEEEEEQEEELADDEEWEYYDVDEDGNEIIASDQREGGRVQDDSMEQLLADARSMRASSSSALEEESSMKDTIFEVISTIVTVDFFVVVGLLVWFLAGIFCSTVLGNDAVQIAFNMNFERVTQPALGILMIGSIAGAVGNNDDDEE